VTRPLRVLHLYRTYFPDPPGGIAEAIRQMSRALRRAGGEARVFALSPHPKPVAVEDGGIPVTRSRSWAAPASCDLGGIASFRAFHQLSAWADLVHFHFPWPFADLLNLVVRTDKAKVMTYHSDVVRQSALNALYRPLMAYTLRDMDAVVATSPTYAATSPVLSRLVDASRLRVIPLGIEDLVPAGGRREIPPGLSARLGLQGQPFVLFIGALRYYKGLHSLVRAAASIEVPVVIAGEGPEAGRLLGLARELGAHNVVFAGQVSDEEKRSLLARCAVFVLPSQYRSEAFGMVLVEASMFSRPLVCCEIGSGTSFVNVDGETGFVVPPEDPAALADAINRLLSDPPLAARLGRGARARYERLFSGGALGKAYMALYREVMDK
jgi:rhamnosyl/mannosyltransferase